MAMAVRGVISMVPSKGTTLRSGRRMGSVRSPSTARNKLYEPVINQDKITRNRTARDRIRQT